MKLSVTAILTFFFFLLYCQTLHAQIVFHCERETRVCLKLTDTGIAVGADSLCQVDDTTCEGYHVDITNTSPDLCLQDLETEILYEVQPINESYVVCRRHEQDVYNLIAKSLGLNQECNVTAAVSADVTTGSCDEESSPTECSLRLALQRAEDTSGTCPFFQINLISGLTYQISSGAYPLSVSNREILIASWAAVGNFPAPIIDGSSNTDQFINATLTSSTLTLQGLVIQNFLVGTAGAGLSVVSVDSTLNIFGTQFISNRANNGGAVYVEANSGSTSVQVLNSVFTSNSVLAIEYGGAISLVATGTVSPNSILSVSSSVFTANSARGGGGAISVKNFPQVQVQSSQFFSNKVVDNVNPNDIGGALLVESEFTPTTVNILDSTFTGNSAQKEGGDIYLKSTPILNVVIQGSIFTSSSASDGGSIYLTGTSSNLQVSDSTFNRCVASTRGGAVYIIANSFDLSGSTFTENRVNTYGGSLFVDNTDLQISISNFYENSAGVGGGAIALSRDVTAQVTASTFSQNSANLLGGGIYYADTTSRTLNLTLVSTNFNSNSAGNGGAMSVQSTKFRLTTQAVTISDNLAGISGGGFHINTIGAETISITNTNFIQNSAVSFGGAFVWTGSAAGLPTLSISESLFESNTAANEGAAFYMDKGLGTPVATVQISSTTFRTNTGGSGTGVTATSGDNSILECRTCSFENNRATNGEGSAFNVNGFRQFGVYGSSVTGNLGYAAMTYDNGAGVSDVIIRDTVFRSNTNNANDLGGSALDIVGSSNFIEVSNCTFLDNANIGSQGYGAGIRILTSNGEVLVQNSKFLRNSAIGFGGALMVRNNVNIAVTVKYSIFEDNSSGDLGGAVYLANTGSVVTLTGNIFRRNIAPNTISGHGGGMHVQGFSSVVVEDSEYTDNSAALFGGGMRIGAGNGGQGTVTIRNTTVTNNRGKTGGGIYLINFNTLNLQTSEIRDNTASDSGGGVYTTGVPNSAVTSIVVENNNCNGNGCGYYNSGNGLGYLTMSSTEIMFNRGGVSGGGMYSQNHGVGTITDTTISSNTASSPDSATERGGGLFVTGASSSTSMLDSVVKDNKAEIHAGGIFVNSGHTISLLNTLIDSNMANQRGGGLYMNLATLNMNNVNWTNNAANQGFQYFTATNSILTFSGYVCFNPAAPRGCKGAEPGTGIDCNNSLCPF